MHEQPGLISLQRSQEPGSERSQADGKCFYLAHLSSLLKVRFFWESRVRAETDAVIREKEIVVS